jgi:hypothetical protein
MLVNGGGREGGKLARASEEMRTYARAETQKKVKQV